MRKPPAELIVLRRRGRSYAQKERHYAMKKLLTLIAAVGIAAATFAALDFYGARAIPVLTGATTINSGATNTTEVAAAGLKGTAELFVTASGNASRTALNLSLWKTNTVEGGWVVFAAAAYTATNAGVYRLTFPAEYITNPSQVRIDSQGAATTATAFILSY